MSAHVVVVAVLDFAQLFAFLVSLSCWRRGQLRQMRYLEGHKQKDLHLQLLN